MPYEVTCSQCNKVFAVVDVNNGEKATCLFCSKRNYINENINAIKISFGYNFNYFLLPPWPKYPSFYGAIPLRFWALDFLLIISLIYTYQYKTGLLYYWRYVCLGIFLITRIYFGINGNRWIWKKNPKTLLSKIKKTQIKWAILDLIVILGSLYYFLIYKKM